MTQVFVVTEDAFDVFDITDKDYYRGHCIDLPPSVVKEYNQAKCILAQYRQLISDKIAEASMIEKGASP